MCIIYEFQPEVSIDKEVFETSVLNNPDGFGIVVANGDGTCFVQKKLEFDTDWLFNLIDEEYVDNTVMVHLRYTTAGTTCTRNLHPFPILEKSTDGVDLWMSHNGTLTSWKHSNNSTRSWESDTRHFVREFVRPLFKRLIKGMSSEEILKDPFVYKLLDAELSALSVLSFIDGYGNTLQVNPLGNGGKYEDGLYYSNEYSFDPTHRQPSSYSRGTGGASVYKAYNNSDWKLPDEKGQSSNGKTSTVIGTHAEDTMQKTFTEKWNLYPDDIFQVTDDFIDTLVDEGATDDLALLVKEALFRAYEAEKEVASLTLKKQKAEKLIEELQKKVKEDEAT